MTDAAQPLAESGYPETEDIFTSSDGYASRFGGPVGEWMLSVQERLVLAGIRESGARTVLDVGGGHAQLAGPLARAGCDVTVLGSDESCAKRLQPDVDAGRVTFRAGNVIDLPFEDGAFDAVVSVRLLPHCVQWPKLISEFCRVARSCVIVDYPARHGFNTVAPLFFGAKKKLEGNTRTWRDFTNVEVWSEFEKCGYELRSATGQFFFPMVLHRSLKCRAVSALVEAPFRAVGITRRWGSPMIAVFGGGKRVVG